MRPRPQPARPLGDGGAVRAYASKMCGCSAREWRCRRCAREIARASSALPRTAIAIGSPARRTSPRSRRGSTARDAARPGSSTPRTRLVAVDDEAIAVACRSLLGDLAWRARRDRTPRAGAAALARADPVGVEQVADHAIDAVDVLHDARDEIGARRRRSPLASSSAARLCRRERSTQIVCERETKCSRSDRSIRATRSCWSARRTARAASR